MLHCGLLGETLGHSYSPMIHHALADYDYRLFEVPKPELDAFLKTGAWDGLNVTIPYKKAVVPYCDALSEAAARLQSVNTLVRRVTERCTVTTPTSLAFCTWSAAAASTPPGQRRWCWAAAAPLSR